MNVYEVQFSVDGWTQINGMMVEAGSAAEAASLAYQRGGASGPGGGPPHRATVVERVSVLGHVWRRAVVLVPSGVEPGSATGWVAG